MDATAEPLRIDVWSDVACPWCYLGKRRLERALAAWGGTPAARPVAVTFHSYQLNPRLPADFAGAHAAYLAAELGMSPEQVAASSERLRALGAADGIDYRFDRAVIVNTLKAHELLHLARAAGRQAEVKERLLRAQFTEGRDLGRLDTLAEIAAEAGLDPDAARRDLEAGTALPAVRADIEQAARLGIRGVPFFVLDRRYALSGAQEPEAFLAALDAAAAAP